MEVIHEIFREYHLSLCEDYVNRGSILLLCTTLFFWLVSRAVANKRDRKLPGPPVWPIVGSLPHLRSHLDVFRAFRRKYGDIYYLELGLFGSKPTVIISSTELAHEALLAKKDEFAGRHRTPIIDVFSVNGHDIIFGDFNQHWMYQKKIAFNGLRKFVSSGRLDEVLDQQLMMIFYETFNKSENKPVDMYRVSSLMSFNLMASICFSEKFHKGEKEINYIIDALNRSHDLLSGVVLSDLHPLLRYIPTKAAKQFQKDRDVGTDLVKEVCIEHQKHFDKNDIRDLADYIIDIDHEMKASGLQDYQTKMGERQFRLILEDMLYAGTDPTRSTLTWAFMFLAAHPEIQDKAQKEIDREFGRDGQITTDKRHQVPYCEAILFETLRIRPPSPFGIPHATTCDTTLGEYKISKGTQVIIDLLQIHNDPRVWNDPHNFRPERFMDSSGNLAPRPKAFMPFSAGRRQCAGQALVKFGLHTILAKILQRFRFCSPDGKAINLVPKEDSVLFYLPENANILIKER